MFIHFYSEYLSFWCVIFLLDHNCLLNSRWLLLLILFSKSLVTVSCPFTARLGRSLLTLEEFPLSLCFCLFIFSVVTDVFSLWGIVFPLHPLSNFITTGDFSSPSIIVPHLPWADAKNEIMLKFPKILSQLSCPNPRCSSLLWAHEGLAQIERIYLCPAMVILRLYRHPRTQGKEVQVNRDFFCEFDSFELWDIMPIKQRHWKFFFGFILFIYFF